MHEAETFERVRAALSHIDPDCDRDTWVKHGMCLKNEFGDAGFDLWDEWSSRSEKYRASDARSTWKSIKADGGRTISTLIYDAKQAGWQDGGTHKRPSPAEMEARRAAAAERAQKAAEEQAAAHEAAAGRAQAIWDDAAPCESHPYLERKGVASHGLRVGRWERIDEETGEVTVVSNNCLLIPIRDRQRRLWSLQGIFVDPKAKKLYLKGGAKAGNFFPVGKPQQRDGRPVFILAEGYATAASVHAATGHAVLVCFDVANLMAVARSIRERSPDAWLVLAADNDTETEGNPGLTTARKVAAEVGGLVAVPPPGDFNELQASEGMEAVAGCIEAAFMPAAELPPELVAAEDAPLLADEPARAIPDDNVDPDLDEIDPAGHFNILGYDRGTFFVFIHEQRQISSFSPGELSEANLLMMAPLDWWEFNFPADKGGMSRKLILNWFFRTAARRGIFDASRLRGRGAWDDDGRVVYHQGSLLYVDGVATDVTRIRSRYVYELAKTQSVPADVPLSDDEGRSLLAVAKMFRWSKPGAAALLAGWTFLAPICGAIRWRPHIWLTGGAGSGKSTILNDYVSVCIGETKLFSNGNSTEAGLRQKLKADAIPVLFDEAEQNDDAEKRRIAPILALIRQSSTESVAQTYKGSISGESMSFHIRSMFCLASIQAGMENKADQDRLTKLSLLKAQDDAGAPQAWAALEEALYKIRRDSTLANRMLRRGIDMLQQLQQNITVFVEVAARKFGTQRLGDQYGAMLAGTWTLTQSVVATPADAEAMIDAYEWEEFTEAGEIDDPEKAVQTILEAKISHKGEVMSVGSIVAAACGQYVDGLTLDDKLAGRLLRDHGMDVSAGHLLFQNGSEALKRLVHGTKFESDLKALIGRLPGAKRTGAHRFAPGVVARAIGIPVKMFIDDEPPI